MLPSRFWTKETTVDPAGIGAEWGSHRNLNAMLSPRAVSCLLGEVVVAVSLTGLQEGGIRTTNIKKKLATPVHGALVRRSGLVHACSTEQRTAKCDLMQPPGVTSHITSGGSKRPRTRPKRTAARRNYRLTVLVRSIRFAGCHCCCYRYHCHCRRRHYHFLQQCRQTTHRYPSRPSHCPDPDTVTTRATTLLRPPRRRPVSVARAAAGCPTRLLDSAARPIRPSCPA